MILPELKNINRDTQAMTNHNENMTIVQIYESIMKSVQFYSKKHFMLFLYLPNFTLFRLLAQNTKHDKQQSGTSDPARVRI
jgi:hypothetical protein